MLASEVKEGKFGEMGFFRNEDPFSLLRTTAKYPMVAPKGIFPTVSTTDLF